MQNSPKVNQGQVLSKTLYKTLFESNQREVRPAKHLFPKQAKDQDDEFEPQYHTMKKLKMPINRTRLQRGNWTLQENRIYLKFLSSYPQFFATEADRRQHRVFCRLSQLLQKKRTPDQCRSHHQKLIDPLNGCISSLILKLQRKIGSMQEKMIQGVPKKPTQRRAAGSELEQQENEVGGSKSKLTGWDAEIPACKLNGREISRTIQQDFFRMTLFKDCSTILIEIKQGRIGSF